MEEVGFSVVGVAGGASVGTEVGEVVVGNTFVGAALVGLRLVGLEFGVSVVRFAEGASVGTPTCPLFVSLKVPPTTLPFFIS